MICCRFDFPSKALQICVLGSSKSETWTNFFHHCCGLWAIFGNKLFSTFWENWHLLNQFLQVCLPGFHNRKENKILWQCVVYKILWLERNAHIFDGVSSLNLLYDRIIYETPICLMFKTSEHILFQDIIL